jgi:hypothetical protein
VDVELVLHEGDLELLLFLEASLVLAGVESYCGAALLKPVDESDLVGGARGLPFSRGGLLADKAQELLVVVGALQALQESLGVVLELVVDELHDHCLLTQNVDVLGGSLLA